MEFSYGANAEFADMAVEVLQEYGFQEEKIMSVIEIEHLSRDFGGGKGEIF